ncbi:helix-turn-helix domain-containing protein [Chengkuizengella marina]|uniref:ImmA/IrrE family metallo-endopeptidase n=1 Tax=Chengkuizengella marina TaxID=2507566 RepID=A0A6N9Q8M5_9BACL|nr:XRE family transcriptional regulator [Chengkuizengella marina]NBI31246.1 ImmA/IrrE family metallo-endopeptidase [Chengkuizengella marina]
MLKFNPDRLRSARLYEGYTIEELAKKTSVSKQAISQYENDNNDPSLETLMALMHTLDFPREYFYGEDEETRNVNTFFRSLFTTSKKERKAQEEKLKRLTQIYQAINKYVKFPKTNIPEITDDMINDIESLTMYLREYWSLGDEPISNMVYVLEKNGFIVTSLPTNTKKIDACSNLQVVKSEEKCIVVLGNDKRTAVRRQFDCTHELGHLVMHKWALDMETVTREKYKVIEKQADQFASSFLLPKEAFLNDLIYPNRIEYYIELKKKWKVSIQAMIIRAYNLDVLSYNQYQYLMRQVGARKWRTEEPLDDKIPIPEPTALNKAVNLIINHNVLTPREFLKEINMNQEKTELLLGLDKGTLSEKKEENDLIIELKTDKQDIQKVKA